MPRRVRSESRGGAAGAAGRAVTACATWKRDTDRLNWQRGVCCRDHGAPVRRCGVRAFNPSRCQLAMERVCRYSDNGASHHLSLHCAEFAYMNCCEG